MPAGLNPGPGYVRNPQHRVDLSADSDRLRIVFDGEVIADTRAAIVVNETNYRPVHCIPPTDVRMEVLRPARTRRIVPTKVRRATGRSSLAASVRKTPSGPIKTPMMKSPAFKAIWRFILIAVRSSCWSLRRSQCGRIMLSPAGPVQRVRTQFAATGHTNFLRMRRAKSCPRLLGGAYDRRRART